MANDLDACLPHNMPGRFLVPSRVDEVTGTQAKHGAVGEEVGGWIPRRLFRLVLGVNHGGCRAADPPHDVWPERHEAKMIHYFDHRLGTYEGQTEAQANVGTLPRLTPEQQVDPYFAVMPRYWLGRTEVAKRLERRAWVKDWLLGWREIARSSDERTFICDVIPRVAVGNKILLAMPRGDADLLVANLSSFVLDYVLGQKMAGTSLSYFLTKQLPVLSPLSYSRWIAWMRSRVLELTYTAWDMQLFARDLGDDDPPFRWDSERRFVMRTELDAAFFHLYGIDRDDVNYIMETFPIVKRKDEKEHGTYRTKDKILEIYDAMTMAKSTGTDYQNALIPPPAKAPVTRYADTDDCSRNRYRPRRIFPCRPNLYTNSRRSCCRASRAARHGARSSQVGPL
jgi:hypothetical protein